MFVFLKTGLYFFVEECLEHTCLRNFLTHCITTSDWYSDDKIFQEPHDLSKREIIHIIDQFTGHTIPVTVVFPN